MILIQTIIPLLYLFYVFYNLCTRIKQYIKANYQSEAAVEYLIDNFYLNPTDYFYFFLIKI